MSRTLTAFGAAALAAGLIVAPSAASATTAEEGSPTIRGHEKRTAELQSAQRGGSEGPPEVTAEDIQFTPGTTLEYGSAAEAGLVPHYLEQLVPAVKSYLGDTPEEALYAGAVVLAGRGGTIATHEAVGYARKYSAYKNGEGVKLPRDEWIPMRRDTIFDLASLTKVFTAVAVMQQVEAGRIELDAPVARYIPEFAQHGKGDILVRQLLTHTSGLPAWLPLYNVADTPEARIDAVYSVKPEAPPGTAYIYSDLGYITLGELVEEVTGKGLDEVIAETITEPLGMDDTMFTPPDSLRHRIAATEYEPWVNRGMVWGSVHDENAWSLGGVAGHAGLFSSSHDLAVFAQMLLNGGVYDGARVLQRDTVRTILTDFNSEFPESAHGLGFALGQHWSMDAMTTPVTFGHTGYTGTSLVVNPMSHSFTILLANNVHPTREGPSTNAARRAAARVVGRAVPVKPAEGQTAWFSGIGNDRTATLTVPLDVPADGGRVKFDLWYSTEEPDIGAFEVSRDGGKTWQPVPLNLRVGGHTWKNDGTFSYFSGRQWIKAEAQLPGGVTHVRWRYTSDALYQGRGVYVDGVRAWDSDGNLIFNGHRPSDAALFQANGWYSSAS